MTEQNYSNHTQRVPLFGVALLLLIAVFLIGGFTLYFSRDHAGQMHNSLMLGTLAFATLLGLVQCRMMALKVQDRAIRAEENLRHFVMTGKVLDSRLSKKQIVAIRFASDDQFVELARQAAEQSMLPDDIKKAVKNWRPDLDRA